MGAQGVKKIEQKPNGNIIVYRQDGVHLLVNPGGYGFFLETVVPDKPKKPRAPKAKKDTPPEAEAEPEPEPAVETKTKNGNTSLIGGVGS